MDKLLSGLADRAAAHEAAAWRLYGELLRLGDAASPDDLAAVLRDLDLDVDTVRQHAAVLSDAAALGPVAARQQGLAAAAIAARQAMHDTRENVKQRRLELEVEERAAERASAIADDAVRQAEDAAERLERLRMNAPFLFYSDGRPEVPPPTRSSSTAERPQRIDPRLASIDPGRMYGEPELVERYGAVAADLRAALPRFGSKGPADPGRYWGGSIVEWARRMGRLLRDDRRRELEARLVAFRDFIVNPDGPSSYTVQALAALSGIPYDVLRLRQVPMPSPWSSGGDTYDAADVAGWRDKLADHNAAVFRQLEALDAEEAPAAVDEPAPAPPAEPSTFTHEPDDDGGLSPAGAAEVAAVVAPPPPIESGEVEPPKPRRRR